MWLSIQKPLQDLVNSNNETVFFDSFVLYYFMKKIILFTVFIYFNSLAQTKCLYVYDAISNEPIPFSTVLFFDKSEKQNGIYADENGLVCTDLIETTSIEISCIGYETHKIYNNSIFRDTIFLKPNATILDEVVLTKKQKVNKFGFNKEKKNKSINTFKGSEIAVFIENVDKIQADVKSVLLDVDKRKDFTVVLKINFYKRSIENKPSELLNYQDIIHYLTKKTKGTIEVEVEDFGIKFPKEGIFVAVECLGFIDEKGSFIKEDQMWKYFRFLLVDAPKNSTFVRNALKTSEWYNELKQRFEEVGINYKFHPNASFGINVYYKL